MEPSAFAPRSTCCNGYRLSKDFGGATEIGIYKDEHLKLKEVKYGRRPPKVNAFHRLIPKFHYSEMEDHYDVPLNIGADAQEKKEDLVGLVSILIGATRKRLGLSSQRTMRFFRMLAFFNSDFPI